MTTVQAQQPSLPLQEQSAPNELTSEVEVRELAENQYSARQQATLEMWRRRDLSRDEVQAAARDSDPEVASRAQWILRQWRRGALPDTPSDISRLLFRTDDPSAIEELLDAGQFNAAVVAVEESAGTADRDAVRSRVVMSLQRRFPIYAIQAQRQNTVADLLKLVDLVADSNEMALTRVELMQRLGVEFDETTMLPESADEWPEAKRNQARVFVFAALGRNEQAMQVAESSRDDYLIRTMRMLDGRWEELARDNAEKARNATPGTAEQVRFWSDSLIAADRCGLEDIRTEAVKALAEPNAATNDTAPQQGDAAAQRQSLVFDLRWKSLATVGEIDAALELLRSTDVNAAALIAIAASRTSLAFEWLGGDVNTCGMNLRERIDTALVAQAMMVEEELAPEIKELLTLMRCFLSVGRSDLAWIIADELSRSSVQIGRSRIRDDVLDALTTSRRDDWMLDLAMLPSDDSITGRTFEAIADVLKDTDQGTLKTLIEAYGRLYPNLALRERFQAACHLVNGESPEKWDSSTDFQRLFEELTIGKPHTQRVGGQVVRALTPQLNLNIVEMFGRHGETELANKALQQMVRLGDVHAAFQVAENQLDAGRATSAGSLYKSIYDAIAGQRSNSQSAIGVTGTDLATKAVAAQWILAKRAGDVEAEARHGEEIRVALCSPSTNLRFAVAEYLKEHGETEFASEIYDTLLPATFCGSTQSMPFFNVAVYYSLMIGETDTSRAAKWFSLATTARLEQYVFFVRWPLSVARWNLETATDQKDSDAVRKHMKRILELNPLDIDTAERVFPKLSKSGMQDIVDSSLEKIFQHATSHLEDFPLDAMTLNNLAWVASINDTRLDDAERWSTRAVYLTPDSAVYRDTLAEVLFRRGKTQQALRIEKDCLLDEPGEWHLHEQIERFEKSLSKE